MKKSFLMRFDKTDAIYDDIKISKLSFDIPQKGLCVVKSEYKDAVFSLILGNTVPYRGYVSLAGVNITDRNANERRVCAMPERIKSKDLKKVLFDAVSEGIDKLTVFEQKREELSAKQAQLRAELKNAPEKKNKIQADIKKARIDSIAIGLKMDRRRDELERNLKAAKALLDAIKQGGLEQKDIYAEKMQAKLFSAQYELCMFTHKQMPSAMLNSRTNYIIDKLSLTESSSDIKISFACAYIKAPELIIYDASPSESELCELSELCEQTQIPIAIITDSSYVCEFGNTVSINDACFMHITEEDKKRS